MSISKSLDFQVNLITSTIDAQRVSDFLLSEDSFENQQWAPGEVEIIKSAPFDSLKNDHHVYWYVEIDGKIVGAMGIRENAYKSGGYVAINDYFAVHREYRRKGIGQLLLTTMEKFVREKKGRYILIETCDTDMYIPARKLYEKHGYHQVGHIPDYYLPGEGKVDYFKKMD